MKDENPQTGMSDSDSLAGLPQPIHEGVKILKQVDTKYIVMLMSLKITILMWVTQH